MVTELKAADFAAHPEFQAFIACWVEDRRAPLPFADWLLERGLESQADAVLWAATEPDRTVFPLPLRSSVSGPYPTVASGDRRLYWMVCSGEDKHYYDRFADCVRSEWVNGKLAHSRHTTIEEALIALLDHWIKRQ